MKVAVLSGKGGTGKTMVSVNLAATDPESLYLDCDVEEPNGHLYFKPEHQIYMETSVHVPEVCQDQCSGCRTCVTFCKFNALAFIQNKVKVFEDLCHSCEGCALLCPSQAIKLKKRAIGKIQIGESKNVKVISGFLNVGEASGVPMIKALLKHSGSHKGSTYIDCPPGSACIVMESIKDADYCILVAEPTLFGTHNLSMVHDLVKLYGKPHGVVLNKCLEGINPAEQYCEEHHLEILGKIPFDPELGRFNSDGEIIARISAEYQSYFRKILDNVTRGIINETTARA